MHIEYRGNNISSSEYHYLTADAKEMSIYSLEIYDLPSLQNKFSDSAELYS